MTVLQTIALPLGYSAAALGAGAIGYVLPRQVSMPGLVENGRFFKKPAGGAADFQKGFF
jgi:hypothetical protein